MAGGTPGMKAHDGLSALDARYVSIGEMQWAPSPFEGIQTKILYSDPETGLSTILFKMEPGAIVPDHIHTAIEQTYMLEGSLEDDQGACTAGNYVWRPGGNRHTAHAPNGALFISMFMKPNQFMTGTKFFTEEK
ncbi:MAG: cupin domain-containing protein [Sheuella sp.]|nr:cupin domain-containing protein [Sheuella sp.]